MRFGPKAHQYAKTCFFALCWPGLLGCPKKSSSCLAAAGRPRLVSLPAALLLPWGAGRASFSRVSRLSVLRTVMESTACSRCTSPYWGLKLRAALVGALKAPASSMALMRRSVRSLLCWNLSALSCSSRNSVAGCRSTSSGAP